MTDLLISDATPNVHLSVTEAELLKKIDGMLKDISHLSIVQASEVSDTLLDMRLLITSRN